MKDIFNVVGEGFKIFLKRGNFVIGLGCKFIVYVVFLVIRL